MGTLAGFPIRDQLNEPTQDGKPDENKSENCLPTSLGSCIAFKTGKTVYGDTLKDKAYGQGHIGGGSGYHYEAVMRAYGLLLAPYNGPTQQSLIEKIKSEIDAGNPVIVTMPSAWGTAPANPRAYHGGSHCGAAYAYDAGTLTVANPWHGFAQRQTFAWWAARLLYGQVWPVSKLAGTGGGSGGDTGMATVPSGWHDDGATLTAANGIAVVRGFRELVLGSSWDAANVPHAPETGDANSSFQVFSGGIATWHNGAQPAYAPCAALVAALTAPQVIPDRYSKALAAIDALATAVAADKAA